MSSFLIGFSSNLQITETGIKPLRSSKSSKIWLVTVKLPTLSAEKTLVFRIAPSLFYGSLSSLQVTKKGPDQTFHPWVSRKAIFYIVRSIAPSFLIGYSSNLQVTRTGKIFEFGPHRTIHFGIICSWAWKIFLIYLYISSVHTFKHILLWSHWAD